MIRITFCLLLPSRLRVRYMISRLGLNPRADIQMVAELFKPLVDVVAVDLGQSIG